MVAAEMGHTDVMKVLLEAGADAAAQSSEVTMTFVPIQILCSTYNLPNCRHLQWRWTALMLASELLYSAADAQRLISVLDILLPRYTKENLNLRNKVFIRAAAGAVPEIFHNSLEFLHNLTRLVTLPRHAL